MRASLPLTPLVLLLFSCAPPSPGGERASPAGRVTPTAPEEGAPPGAARPGSNGLPPAKTPGSSARERPVAIDLPLVSDCVAPVDYASVELEVLLGEPHPWDGERIAVAGPVFPQVICSAMECPPVAICCKRCWTTHHMNGPESGGTGFDNQVAIELAQPECVKTCECAEEIGPVGDTLVWGTARAYDDGVAIEVDGYCER